MAGSEVNWVCEDCTEMVLELLAEDGETPLLVEDGNEIVVVEVMLR